MKNLISFDSIYRVRPTAKVQNEAQQKILNDAEYGIKNLQQQLSHQQKKVNESENSALNPEREGKRNFYRKKPKSKDSNSPKNRSLVMGERKNKFYGGRLFDSEA